MDISKLDINHIELFAAAYSTAKQVFNFEPITATAKMQKKIRKWVTKTYITDNPLPQNVLEFIDDSRSDADFIAFMATCAKHIEAHGAWKKQLFEKVAVDFSEDVKKAFLHLFETMIYCEVVEQQEGKIIFLLDEVSSYKRKLILHTSKENNLGNFEALDFSDAQILKEEDGYKLICVSENYNEEIYIPIGIYFDQATTEVEVYRADRRTFCDTPWETLAAIASEILNKQYLGDGYLNAKEEALLPLLKEIRALSIWAPLYEENPSFEILKQYIRKHNLPHLIPLLDKFAAKKKNKPFSPLLFSRVSNKFNEAACEGLWRELYALVADTQEGYAVATNSYSQQKFNQIKRQIEESFHKLGYEGTYPTFRKHGAMKGLHLAESYSQTYFVGLEKNVSYIVQCKEFWNFDTFSIQFLCGTALLKKGETITDIYSCCFHKNGRRLFKLCCWDSGNMDTLGQFITIVAKKAECAKLDKEEKKLLDAGISFWSYFIALFIFAGGLFAIIMTAAIFLICCLVTAIIFGFSDIPEMIRQMPWWFFFAISFLGFGGTMAIVDTKAKMK